MTEPHCHPRYGAGRETRAVLTVPGSDGLFSPQLSPDGRYVAAFPTDASRKCSVSGVTHTYLLRRRLARRFAPIATAHAVRLSKRSMARNRRRYLQFNNWSRDGRKIYILDISGSQKSIWE